jgi:hypothetical protein
VKKKSIEQFFINTILGYKPDEVLWEENNYDGFPLGQSSLRYFKFDLDGDIVRVRAHKLPNGDWKVEEVGINGEWFGVTSNGLEQVFVGYTLS